MKNENKTSDFSNDKNYIRIVLSRKTLVAAICIILAIVAVAFVLHEVFREKYNVTPTVMINFVSGEYRKLEVEDKVYGAGIDTDYGWYLPYTGEVYVPEVYLIAEGQNVSHDRCEHNWTWRVCQMDENKVVSVDLKEKGLYFIDIDYDSYATVDGVKYRSVDKRIAVVIY